MIQNIIFSIAKKEIMDNIRNKWIIIMSISFAVLTLLVSYAGSIGSGGWQDLSGTVEGMSVLVNYFLTIIALMLSYSAIIGEIERGSMSSLISLPVKRLEIILGKFLGLGAVLTFTILVGFGVAGIVIGTMVPNVDYWRYLLFIGATVLVGLVFLSIGILLSCLLKKRSTAMGSAIFVFFLFTIIWGLILAALLIVTGNIQFSSDPNVAPVLKNPDWQYAMNFLNPLSAYGGIIKFNVLSSTDATYPAFYNSVNVFIALLIWLFAPLIVAYWAFKNKDI